MFYKIITTKIWALIIVYKTISIKTVQMNYYKTPP